MDNDFNALRSALLGDDLKNLQHLTEELSDKTVYTNRMSDNLPVAIVQCAADSDTLINSMKLPVLGSLTLAVDSHREQVTKMLAPVIMPVIGQAVAKATLEIKDSIETLINSMFTVQGIKWRIQSSKTGKPYSEIAFKDKHQFNIEHIAYNAKKDGNILNKASKESYIQLNNENLRSAIDGHISIVSQRVKITSDLEPLDCKEFGLFNVYTVSGVWSSLSVVVSGIASEEFLSRLRRQFKSIEIDLNNSLKNYRSEKTAFEPLTKTLNQLLDFVPSKSVSKALVAPKNTFSFTKLFSYLVLLVLVCYVAFTLFSWYEKIQIRQALNKQKGFVTLGIEGDSYIGWEVKGMQDPNIFSIKSLNLSTSIQEKLTFNTLSFISLGKESILARLNKKLPPLSSVQYEFNDAPPQTLTVKGVASDEWVAKLKEIGKTVEGLEAINTDAVTRPTDFKTPFEAAITQLESLVLEFPNKSTDFSENQKSTLDQATSAVKVLVDLSAKNNVKVSFLVSTHISGNSPRIDNVKLLFDRYIAVKEHFTNQLIDPKAFIYAEQVEKPLNLPAATIMVIKAAK